MIHFSSEHVKLVELEKLQVIVGSYGHYAYLEETMKSSTRILYKHITFLYCFMSQTLYFHVFTLMCQIKVHKLKKNASIYGKF